MIVQSSIDELIATAHIEDVIGEYITLKKSGSSYKGLCPFHNEKSPSFMVTPSKGIYKCFGCQKGGNAIHFVKEIESISFTEAARQLATKYQLQLVETKSRDSDDLSEEYKLKESLQIVMNYAHEFYKKQLWDSENGQLIALPYFKERGFTHETIVKWGLGFSPDAWDAFYQQAISEKYNLDHLEKAGLVKKRDNSESYYDVFRNRVLFPILSVSGKTIAFGGRIMGKSDKTAKYVNSPETILYKKSDVVFGLFQAKHSIKRLDKVLMTEGYTDVITLAQNGIENVVSSSGTALTPGQIKALRQFTSNVAVIYDGDNAGIKASLRGIDLLLEEDLNVWVVALPDGEDPDSYCAKLGGEGFAEYLSKNEQNFIFYKADLLMKEVGNDPIKKVAVVRDILESVSCIRDNLKRNTLARGLASYLQMNENEILIELQKLVIAKGKKLKNETLQEITDIIQFQSTEGSNVKPFQKSEGLNTSLQEIEFMQMMVLYGDLEFYNGETVYERILLEMQQITLAQLEDELVKSILKGIFEQELFNYPGQNWFVSHHNEKISQWAAGVLSKNHQLSNRYSENYIYVVKENENIASDLLDRILHLRRKYLEIWRIAEQHKIMELQDAIEQDTQLQLIQYIDDKRLELAKMLNISSQTLSSQYHN